MSKNRHSFYMVVHCTDCNWPIDLVDGSYEIDESGIQDGLSVASDGALAIETQCIHCNKMLHLEIRKPKHK